MKNKKSIAIIWALVMLLVLTPVLQMPAMAADVTNEVMTAEATTVGLKNARLPQCFNWLFAMHLRLSEKSITLKEQETHEIEVIPNRIARLLGWKIKEVKVDGKTAEVCEVDKNTLKVTIKGVKEGESVVEIYLTNAHYISTMTRVLKCTVTTKKATTPANNCSNEGWNTRPKPVPTPDPVDPNPIDPNPVDPEPVDPNPVDPNPVDPTPELRPLDTSKLKFEPSSLSVTYDGESHLPILTGVPDGVELVWRSEAVTNAGSDYEITVGFKVPDGYEPIPDMTTQFEIKKADVATMIGFDEENEKIIVAFDGVMPNDTTSETFKSWVNGEEFDSEYKITEPGRYVTTTEVNVDIGKADNYTGLDALETAFNVKRDQAWYRLSTTVVQEDDKVILKVYISNVNVRQGDEDGFTIFALGFDIDYDKSVLTQQFEDGVDYVEVSGEDTWEGLYRPDRREEGDTEEEEKDVILTYDAAPIKDKSLVCSITYDIRTDENTGLLMSTENLQFTVINATLAAEAARGEDYDYIDDPFEYKTDSETVILNPSEDAPEEKTVYISNDLLQDVEYQGDKDDEEEMGYYVGELQDYIDNGFQIISEEESEVEEQSEPESEPKQETEEGEVGADSETKNEAIAE